MSRPSSRPRSRRRHGAGLGVLVDLAATTTSVAAAPACSGRWPFQRQAHRLHLVGLEQRVADLVAWAARKVKHMPPPTTRLSTRPRRLSSTASLSETLLPPSTAANGRSGSSSSRDSTWTRWRAGSRRRRAAARPPRPPRRASGGRPRRRRPRRPRPGRRSWSARRLFCLARLVAKVLEQQHLASPRASAAWRAWSPATSSTNRTSVPRWVARTGRTGSSEYFGSRLPLGRPRWEQSPGRRGRAATAAGRDRGPDAQASSQDGRPPGAR